MNIDTAWCRPASTRIRRPVELDRYQFEVLSAHLANETPTQRDIADSAGISLGSVNKASKACKEAGLITDDGSVTEAGLLALAPYKVDSAVILAAGAASRMAPLSFEKPKALFEVQGEILIERLIKQIKAAGIKDISVVVGHMKESFFYLGDKFDVNIISSRDYANRNNHSSLFLAREHLGNSYICASDQYIVENPFRPYVFEPCMPMFQSKPESRVRAITWDKKGIITGMERRAGWYPRGPVYLDTASTRKLMAIIEEEYDYHETKRKLWDTIFLEHAGEFAVRAKKYQPGEIYEFDQLQDLLAFDRDFLINVDSAILDNICKTLDCERADITQVVPLKAGLTNLSVLFNCKGERYVYRHPGAGTDEIINRQAETFALNAAKRLGLDETFLYENAEEGWKISRFIEGCTDFDYRNTKQVKQALQLIKRLHGCDEVSPWSFDFYEATLDILRLLGEISYPLPRDFAELKADAGAIAEAMKQDRGQPCLCHNDFYGPNLLVHGDDMWVIDWEYAAMGDWACDLGNFVAQGSGYSVEEAIAMLDLYFNRKPSETEVRHCVAAVGIVGFYWYVWAMYKEAMGNPVGEWLYTWYKAAKSFIAAAKELY